MNFCSLIDTVKRMKTSHIMVVREYLQIMYMMKDVYTEYIKNSQNSVRKPNFKNGQKI